MPNKMKVLAFAKFQAVLTSMLGLVLGIIYALGGFIIDGLVSAELLSPDVFNTSGLSYGTVLAIAAMIGMPLLFAVFGFITGILEALLFNLCSARFGAIEVDFWR